MLAIFMIIYNLIIINKIFYKIFEDEKKKNEIFVRIIF